MLGKAQLRIGLLVDAELTPAYTYELAEWGQRQSNLSICALIVQKAGPSHTRTVPEGGKSADGSAGAHLLARSSFQLLRGVESVRLARNYPYKDQTRQHDLSKAISKCVYVQPALSKGGYLYSEEDLRTIKALDLDLIIMCGSGLLRGEILKSSTLGILALQYGEDGTVDNGPPGFQEVYHRQGATEFAIVQLMEEPTHCNVLMRGRLSTKHYYLLNHAALGKRSAHYLSRLLDEIATTRILPPPHGKLAHTIAGNA